MSEYITLPGLVDIHTHLREPGTNKAETIASGTRVALLGGYALLGDMPNNPGRETWSEELMLEKHSIARETAYIPTTYHAGSQPESDNVGQLRSMAALSLWLKNYGGITTSIYRDYEAREFRDSTTEWHRAAPLQPIGFHAGRDNLEDMIAMVAGDFNHPLHIHHISTDRAVQLVLWAKQKGWPVTSGVTVHHLLKTSHEVWSEGWFAMMQPPLVEQAESEKLMFHLANGDIDIIETDHAPHAESSKMKAELENPNAILDGEHTTCFGVPSIGHAASLMFYQVKRGRISMERTIDAMSTRPAEILGVKLSKKTKFLWDTREFRIGHDDDVESRSGWTPFLGKLAVGTVHAAKINGQQLVTAEGQVDATYPLVVTSRGSKV
jgi:dihydroorotase